MISIPWLVAIALLLAVCPPPLTAGGADGETVSSGTSLLFRLYRDHISVTDGHRCVMSPSCSEYARKAFQKHGPVIGWVMTCDRLVRCGRDEVNRSPHVLTGDRVLVYDPVEANDFWWFTPGEPGDDIQN